VEPAAAEDDVSSVARLARQGVALAGLGEEPAAARREIASVRREHAALVELMENDLLGPVTSRRCVAGTLRERGERSVVR